MADFKQPSGREVVDIIRRDTGEKTLLAFSSGKDSIAAFLAIRGRFDEIIPYYLYLVPGLEFVDETLAYYEKALFDGRHIIRMPHPSLYRWLNELVFQPPHHAPLIEAAQLPNFDYLDVQDLIRDQYKAPGAYTATGVRAADSPMRLVSIKQHGPISHTKRQYFPVWDWKKADLMAAFERDKIRLSSDYAIFGRSFDGLDARFMIPMKKHRPRDYARVLEWFPLIEADIFRAERMQA